MMMTMTTTTTTMEEEEQNDEQHVDNLVAASREKLHQTASSIQQALSDNDHDDDNNDHDDSDGRFRGGACRWESTTQPNGYRCQCSFQIIVLTVPENDHSKQQSVVLRYAIRRQGQPVVIDTFPMANPRIQQAMTDLLEYLNNNKNNNNPDHQDHVSILSNHLTSVTFVTSWDPTRTCLVTLHYEAPPLVPRPKQQEWISAARALARQCGWQQLTRRSKGQVLRVSMTTMMNNNNKSSNKNHEEDPSATFLIRDTVYLLYHAQSQTWNVTLNEKDASAFVLSSYNNNNNNNNNNNKMIPVEYGKPEGAFAHPNPNVMCQALAWILNRIQHIVCTTTTTTTKSSSSSPITTTLLELYCGCGAHTMALAKSGLLQRIVAVEWDERLVRACRTNVQLNQLNGNDESNKNNHNNNTTNIQILAHDAGKWCGSTMTTTNTTATTAKQNNDATLQEALILLVDPPRQGLDERVCRMAMQSDNHNNKNNLQHILYISCGRDALVRDLQILRSQYKVVDCVLLDLFPQTYSVESLVHLQRRR